ncbi:MAG: type II secretion system F family protein [Armatimonadetes bacterium]|nr:type II secretion system F family protein [Armatimonadota bacterium]
MPTFEYEAVSADGKREKGNVIGQSLDQALESLTARGLTVEHIGQAVSHGDPLAGFTDFEPVVPAYQPTYAPVEVARQEVPAYQPVTSFPEQPAQQEGPPLGPRSALQTQVVGRIVSGVDLSHQEMFFRQFAAMEKAGVPMVSALETLSNQSHSAKLKEIVLELRDHVNHGRPISAGLQRYPEVFSPLTVSLVRAGEAGGFLPDAMRQIADYLVDEIELKRLYKKITFQPKMVLIASIVIYIATNAFLASVGKGKPLYSPLIDPRVWLVLGPVLIGLFAYFRIGLANQALRYGFDKYVLWVPYLGNTLKQYSMAKFGRAFGALYEGGVPAGTAAEMAADSCDNEYLRSLIHPASQKLQEGAPIAPTLAVTGAFDPIVLNMLATGETTGNVNDMLTKMADYYEDEAKLRSKQLAEVTGIALLLCAGIYVLFLMIGFYGGQAAQAIQGSGALNPGGD